MKETKLQVDGTCPHCGKVNYLHTDFNGKTPKHDDVSICIDCGQFAVFDLQNKCLRLPTADEQLEFERMPEARRYRAAWSTVRGKS
jgi:hypothetical protein